MIDYFLQHVESLSKLSVEEGRDLLELITSILTEGKYNDVKRKGYRLLYECCFHLKLDVKELWSIYWRLTRTFFVNANLQMDGKLDILYKFIYKKVLEMVSTDSYRMLENPDHNVIVIITNQYLSLGHAPTRRVLDYAYAFVTGLNKRVMIINDAGSHCYSYSYIRREGTPVFAEEFNDVQEVAYQGIKIPFLQISAYMPDINSLSETLEKIYQMRPGLVYNIGCPSLLTDLCSLFTATVSMECGFGIPVTMSKYLLVGRSLEESDNSCLQRLEPYQQVIETVLNYVLPANLEEVEYSRSQFGIGEDDFVVGIVGNRLDMEIDDDFLSVMHDILTKLPIHFLLIGPIIDVERIAAAMPHTRGLHFAGKLSDAAMAIKLCDIYCNPMRSGCGRSSFEALANGVPVISLRYGDVYYTCGADFAVEDYKEYVHEAEHYFTNAEYRAKKRERALKRAAVLSEIVKTQDDILKKIFG